MGFSGHILLGRPGAASFGPRLDGHEPPFVAGDVVTHLLYTLPPGYGHVAGAQFPV